MASTKFERHHQEIEKRRKREERKQRMKNFWANLTRRHEYDDEYEDEEESKEDTEEKRRKALLRNHRLWRAINWTIILWLANSAFWKVLKWFEIEKIGALKIVFFAGMLTYALIMVVFAEGTDHDRARRNSGWRITIISEGIMLLPLLKDTIIRILMAIGNVVTRHLGGDIFTAENYKSTGLGFFWVINLALAVGVCVSLLREEQSTDKKLGFARTPQKKEFTDIDLEATDDNGNKVIRFSKYKK